jgi:putative ABC transport system permease protein
MPFREAVLLALQQIRSQKLKSFFAVLGVIIGVMFLITVVSIVEGMNRYMKEDFAKTVFGLNTLTVRRNASVNFNVSEEQWRERRRRPRLTFEEADAIRSQLDIPALVGVESATSGRIVGPNGREIEQVWLTAAGGDFFRIREYEVEKGRLFTAPEDRMGVPVVVLGWEAADRLFGTLDPLGRTVKIQNQTFRVVGVLTKQGSLFGMSLDNRAIAPARSRMGGITNERGHVDEILVRVPDEKMLAAGRLDLEAIMRVQRHLRPTQVNNFEVETADDSMSFWNKISKILYIAFPGLVSIALIVGGMVIMNIMLVSVVERTSEIGVRKALGAKRRDIVLQVLIESATLSGAGAAIGIAIGSVLAVLVRTYTPLPAALSPLWMSIATFMGVSVGVLAGIYPASRAAKLDPVVALRAE